MSYALDATSFCVVEPSTAVAFLSSLCRRYQTLPACHLAAQVPYMDANAWVMWGDKQ